MNQAGKLNIEQYALAMHFVNKKLSTGLDPPIELTPEMIPPSMRPKMPIDVSLSLLEIIIEYQLIFGIVYRMVRKIKISKSLKLK